MIYIYPMELTEYYLALMLASGASLAADGTSSATPPPPQLSNNFNLLDSNADGLLSRVEIAAIVR